MELMVWCSVCVLISAVAIRAAMLFAGRLGIVDRPGGHKQHEFVTPFVGGFGIAAVLVCSFALDGLLAADLGMRSLFAMLLGALAMFLTGLADDVWHLSFKPRFVVQALVALGMIAGGGVVLESLGELLPGVVVELEWLAVPLTVFGTIGLINAVNMIDGVDGLSGTISLTSLAFLALVVAQGGHGGPYLALILALLGALAGFLYFNLRYPGNRRARVFLGDNGSMLLGFLFSWLFIALSQGREAVMSPVTALWLFGLPLMDTVGVMVRRIWLGKSPFKPDRYHFHHLFVRAGFRVSDIVVVAVLLHAAFASIGVLGLLLKVPEYLMFWAFLVAFVVYFLCTLRPWRLVPKLRRLACTLSLPLVQGRGIFIGRFAEGNLAGMVEAICRELAAKAEYRIEVYQIENSTFDRRNLYCVVALPASGDDRRLGEIHRDLLRLRRLFAATNGLDVRLYMRREERNDRRATSSVAAALAQGKAGSLTVGGRRRGERRGTRKRSLVFAKEYRAWAGAGREVIGPEELSIPPAPR